MFIETEITPNPKALKFIPDQPVLESGTIHFTDREKAKKSPLALTLFSIADVTGVLLAPGFISVTIKSGDWQARKPEILGLIMEHFTAGHPVVLEEEKAAASGKDSGEAGEEDSKIVLQIKAVLDEKVRPAVAQDGGDVIFSKFEDGIVYLHMQGACSGCPSSVVTLKSGIENLLKYYIPEVEEVRQT